MLDDLDDGGGVKTFQPLVPVHQRAVDQLETVRLHGRQSIHLQPPLGYFKGADRDIQADDFLELLVLEKFADQLAFTAAQVENSLGAAGPQSRQDGCQGAVRSG